MSALQVRAHGTRSWHHSPKGRGQARTPRVHCSLSHLFFYLFLPVEKHLLDCTKPILEQEVPMKDLLSSQDADRPKAGAAPWHSTLAQAPVGNKLSRIFEHAGFQEFTVSGLY